MARKVTRSGKVVGQTKAANKRHSAAHPTRSGATQVQQVAPAVEPDVEVVANADTPRRRIRLIVPPPEGTPQTMMGRQIRPFAKPAQSGTFAPFAVAQARRGR